MGWTQLTGGLGTQPAGSAPCHPCDPGMLSRKRARRVWGQPAQPSNHPSFSSKIGSINYDALEEIFLPFEITECVSHSVSFILHGDLVRQTLSSLSCMQGHGFSNVLKVTQQVSNLEPCVPVLGCVPLTQLFLRKGGATTQSHFRITNPLCTYGSYCWQRLQS